MLKKYFTPLLLSAAMPMFAEAEIGNFSGGAKLGMFMVDSDAAKALESATGGNVELDNAVAFGLHGDVMIAENCYIDFEYMASSVDASLQVGTFDSSTDIDIETFAIYGAYRSPGDFYYLGKLGVLHEKVDGGGLSESETGLSFAVGGGYKIQENFFVEAEFTSIEEDVGFVGLTARYMFQ